MKKTLKVFPNFTWLDVQNPNEAELKALDLPFKIDENFLEDSLESGHLPKIERVDDYVFLILRAHAARPGQAVIDIGQLSTKLSFFIHPTGLLTLHRLDFPFIQNLDKTSYESPDALALELINHMLLSYEGPLKQQSERMDIFEREIFLQGGKGLSIEALYYEKSKARLSKKILLITQNVLNQFKVYSSLQTSLQDLKDTTLDLLLQAEEIIEDANTLLNSYLSVTAQKNNDVMKLLTVFSVFFLPLTFIVGVYGMNFDYMPELHWQYSYFITLGSMVFICFGIYLWFKKKHIL